MNRFDIPAESFQLRSSVQTATDSLEESEREKERAVTLARYRVYESLDTSVRRMSDKCVVVPVANARARAPRQYNKFLLRQ